MQSVVPSASRLNHTPPVRRVVYIGGAGRSGSTFLESLLSSNSDCVCVGEMRWIWERGLKENHLCSCGQPFRECPFWTAVLDHTFDDSSVPDARELIDRQRSLDRIRYIFPLAFPRFRSAAFTERLLNHADLLARLYSAILKVSGKQVIVDSSKDPTYGYLLATSPRISMSVLHLVRDSRAVAFSWSRKKHRPEIVSRQQYMRQFSTRQAAVLWITSNLLTDGLRIRAERFIRLRYEDYAVDFTAAQTACRALGLNLEEPSISAADGRRTWHAVSGNPLRFDSKPQNLQLDDQWRTSQSPSDFIKVTAMTALVLLRYGYPLRRRRRSA